MGGEIAVKCGIMTYNSRQLKIEMIANQIFSYLRAIGGTTSQTDVCNFIGSDLGTPHPACFWCDEALWLLYRLDIVEKHNGVVTLLK